jgi:betaine reductase
MFAETVMHGDPSYAGMLTGIALNLPVFHILEPEIKKQIEPTVYESQVAFIENVLDTEAIIQAIKSVRERPA